MSEPNWDDLLAEQVRLHSRLFYLLAYRMLRDDARAQEVCQQALLRACEHRDRIIDPSVNTLRSWISQTVKTECLQRLRRQRIEQRALAIRSEAQQELLLDPEIPIDLRNAVLEAIALLPEPAQSIVRLRHLDGLTPNEVMVAVGCRRSDLWRHMRWGFDQLRALLADWRYDR